ncbi:membrane protein [Leifsonia bigeumensis]|uniref:Membrane protein n=2 Tax=Leifsonella bigeumensis TaxID=433643 RepID=A0ABP7EZ44_9MICO
MTPVFVMTRRWVQLLLGLFLYGIAIAMMIRAAIGISPWDVLAQGISLRTGIPFGLVTNIVGVVVLLLWIPLRQRLGIGTVLNALLIGPSAEVGLWLIPLQDNIWMRILLFVGGLLLLAIATGLYIGARFGPGPRDGLMTGINKKYGVRIWIVRTSIEIVVLVIGWILGGNVGFGTLAFALLVGPLVHITMPILRVPDAPTTPEPAASPAESR